MWFGVLGSGFGVWGLGFGIWGLWFVVCGLGFWVCGLRPWVRDQGPGCRPRHRAIRTQTLGFTLIIPEALAPGKRAPGTFTTVSPEVLAVGFHNRITKLAGGFGPGGTLSHSHTLALSYSHTLTLSHSRTLTLSHGARPGELSPCRRGVCHGGDVFDGPF